MHYGILTTTILRSANEEIAFLDSMLIPEYFKPKADTSLQDTLYTEELSDTTQVFQIETDSIANDSIINTHYNLYLFTEYDSTQKLIESNLVSNRQLIFVFKQPLLKDNVRIIEPEQDTIQDWLIRDLNKGRDTITFWFKDFIADTLFVCCYRRHAYHGYGRSCFRFKR